MDIIGKKLEIIDFSKKFFTELTSLPQSVRPDDKKRTGIQIFIRIPGTWEQIYESICSPSKNAQTFAVEKAVRSYVKGDFSSWNSRNPSKMEFGGSFSICASDLDKTESETKIVQASVSGLKEEEDAVLALLLLSKLSGGRLLPFNIRDIITKKGGRMPLCMRDPNHYLFKYVAIRWSRDM